MKIPNLLKITKMTKNTKLPNFSKNIKTILMGLLLIFYLVIIVVHFSMKIFETFSPNEKKQIDKIKNDIDNQEKMNATIMTTIIPDIQKNIFDLSNNFFSSFYKNKPFDPKPDDPSSNYIPIKPIDPSSNYIPI